LAQSCPYFHEYPASPVPMKKNLRQHRSATIPPIPMLNSTDVPGSGTGAGVSGATVTNEGAGSCGVMPAGESKAASVGDRLVISALRKVTPAGSVVGSGFTVLSRMA